MEKRYPLKLSYVLKERIWGGNKFASEWGKKAADIGENIGESWELSVRDDEMSKIENGTFAGQTLAEYFESVGFDTVSPTYDGKKFPLLIKLLDACDKLSVQVHPDDTYAAEKEHDVGKTEMWYIIDAEKDASIVYGLADGITKEEFCRCVRENKIGDAMKYQEVKPGDVFFIPSGMLHAIGKGIMIAEIQQNSDLTYRVYDYDRLQADGTLRTLHVDKSLDVVRTFTDDEIAAIQYEVGYDKSALANCRYFNVRLLECANSANKLCADQESFHSLLCIDGEGEIRQGGKAYKIKKGDSYFIPAKLGEYEVFGNLKFIVSSLSAEK